LGTEFLLNARALVKAKDASAVELEPYNLAIKYCSAIKAPHLWYVPKLIEFHGTCFRADPKDVASLPPQSSEALMGWRRVSHRAPEYYRMLAVSRARLAYTVWNTASGKWASSSAMSVQEAKVALPKIISFIRAFDFAELLNNATTMDLISAREKKFSEFLKSDFRELLNPHPVLHPLDKRREVGAPGGAYISPEMIALKDCVPFAALTKPAILNRAAQERDEKDMKAILSGLRNGITAAGVSGALLYKLVGKKVDANGTGREVLEKVRFKIEERDAAIDNGKYKGIEEQQDALGDIDFRKLSGR
jgi:hypothetical protein